MKTINQSEVRKVNKAIQTLTHNQYFAELPVAAISSILSERGLETSGMEGIYCGHEGRSNAQVSAKHYLTMTWYRMSSGNFEVVAYVS